MWLIKINNKKQAGNMKSTGFKEQIIMYTDFCWFNQPSTQRNRVDITNMSFEIQRKFIKVAI